MIIAHKASFYQHDHRPYVLVGTMLYCMEYCTVVKVAVKEHYKKIRVATSKEYFAV
jgi:hypothetical protein